MADSKRKDPTITTDRTDPPEGTHPAVAIEEGADAAVNITYAENPDKPNESTVANVEVIDDEK